MQEPQRFLPSLFDLSFSSLVTPKVIRVLYVLAMVVEGIVTLGLVAGAFRASVAAGILTLLIFGPLFWLWNVIWTRVFLEFLIAVFRIVDSNERIAAKT